MIRNLKVLGLAVVAMLAMSALAASTASASFSSTDEHTFLTASGSDNSFFVTPNTEVDRGFECDEVGFSTNTSTILEVDKTAEQVTVGPIYSKCQGLNPDGTLFYTEPTGCHFLYTDETNAQNRAPVHIVCEEDTEEIRTTFTALKFACLKIPGRSTANVGNGPNQNLTGMAYLNNGNHIDVSANITGITSTTEGVCQVGEEPATHTNGIYTGSITVSGHDTAGNTEDLGYATT
jgi:hypothetical protein